MPCVEQDCKCQTTREQLDLIFDGKMVNRQPNELTNCLCKHAVHTHTASTGMDVLFFSLCLPLCFSLDILYFFSLFLSIYSPSAPLCITNPSGPSLSNSLCPLSVCHNLCVRSVFSAPLCSTLSGPPLL